MPSCEAGALVQRHLLNQSMKRCHMLAILATNCEATWRKVRTFRHCGDQLADWTATGSLDPRVCFGDIYLYDSFCDKLQDSLQSDHVV